MAAVTAVVVPQAAPAQTPPAVADAAAAQKELELYAATLNNPSSRSQDKDLYAARLVSKNSPEADRILLEVLRRASNRDAVLAVCKALASGTNPNAPPNQDFIEPVGNLLGNGDRELTSTAALALAVYRDNERARQRLVEYVGRRNEEAQLRAGVIRAIGKLIDQRAAGTLIEQLDDESQLVREAAIDALVEMTGLSKLGRDIQQWKQWWQENARKSQLDWSRDLLNRNVDRATDLDKRLSMLRPQLVRFIADEYRGGANENERSKRVIARLQAESEDIRWAAAQFVSDQIDKLFTGSPSPAVKQTLRVMVADSSAVVRGKVAEVLGKLNDAEAVDFLYRQLVQEKDPEVRQKIIRALGPSQDPRTVDWLLAELKNPSYSVAGAAADAMKEKADLLRKKENAAQADQISHQLLARLPASGDRSAASFRRSLVELMARIGHPSMLPTFYTLIEDRDLNIRRAAFQGLGRIGNPDSANQIMAAMEREPDRGVRLDAVLAMRTTAAAAHIGNLLERLQGREPDPSVREKIWEVLAGAEGDTTPALFEKASVPELMSWVDRFFRPSHKTVNLERRAIVLRIVERKLLQQDHPNAEMLASVRASIGDTLLSLNAIDSSEESALKRSTEAAEKLQAALEYRVSSQAMPSITDPLVQQTVEALLRARKYSDGSKFMTQMIQTNRINPSILWVKCKGELARLKENGDLKNAAALIDQIKTVPLDAISTERLKEWEHNIRTLLNSGGSTWIHSRVVTA